MWYLRKKRGTKVWRSTRQKFVAPPAEVIRGNKAVTCEMKSTPADRARFYMGTRLANDDMLQSSIYYTAVVKIIQKKLV